MPVYFRVVWLRTFQRHASVFRGLVGWLVSLFTSQQHASVFQSWLVGCLRPNNMLVYFRVGCLLNVPVTCQCISGTDLLGLLLRAATPRYKLQIKLAVSSSNSISTPAQPVLVITIQCQAPGRVATGEHIC